METESTPQAPAPGGFWQTIKNSLSGAHYDYTSGGLSRGVWMLAIPMVLEMVMESLFAVVDVFWVARLGSAAVAAVGLTESMLTILYAVAIGLSMSVTASVARRIGEGNREGAAVYAVQAIGLGVVISAVIAVVCGWQAPTLLRMMGASELVQEVGSGYTRVLMITNVVIMLLFINNAIFRGAGDASLAMKALWLSNGINIVLDPCLIFGWGPFPELGLTGAAIATSIGRGIGVAFQLWIFLRGVSRVYLTPNTWKLNPAAMIRLLRISLGGIGQFLIATASWVALVRILSPLGDVALAGYTIGVRVLMFTILPAWGLSNAAATLVGQNLGAGKPDRAEKSVYFTGLYNMVFLVIVALGMFVFSEQIVSVFTDDAQVAPIASACLKIIALGYPFFAWGMVLTQAFNGSGDTLTPTWMNFFAFWMLELPLAWFLVNKADQGANGVFWAVAAAESFLAVLAYIVFKRGKWKEGVA